MDILGLTDYRIIAVNEDEHDFHIQAECISLPSCCAHCGHSKLYRHEVKPQLYMDMPIRGKRVGIIVQRKRYRCCECRRTFFEAIPHMDEHHFMTLRLVNYFTYRYTAGYTESLNGLMKLLAREGRGFSFEVIRAKVLLTSGLRKTSRPGYGKTWETSSHGWLMKRERIL